MSVSRQEMLVTLPEVKIRGRLVVLRLPCQKKVDVRYREKGRVTCLVHIIARRYF